MIAEKQSRRRYLVLDYSIIIEVKMFSRTLQVIYSKAYVDNFFKIKPANKNFRK